MVRHGKPGIMLDRIFSEHKLRGGDSNRFPGGDGYFVRTTDGKRIGVWAPEATARHCVSCLSRLRHRAHHRAHHCAHHCAGPMTEREFNIVRTTNDVLRVASAWRESGGAVFKVQLKSQVKWDFKHALSCTACNHCFELATIVFCFFCTICAFLLLNTKQLKKEREQAGMGMLTMLGFLFALTIVMVIATLRKLMQRWHRASSEVYVSEV